MAIEFEITSRRAGADTHVISVTGEVDLFTVPEFKRHVGNAIEAGSSSVVVDLSATTFIDSSSLGVLIGAHRRLGRQGGELTVVCGQESILKTFRITGLDGVFRIESTLDDALDSGAVSAGS